VELYYQPQLSDHADWLDEEESGHCRKVMRKREGDVILVTDGKGRIDEVRLTEVHERKCRFVCEKSHFVPPDAFRIEVAVAPTKNTDRMEWFVEKSVELGIHAISFPVCRHSVRKVVPLERLRRIAISASKQSGRAWLPSVHAAEPFDILLERAQEDQKFIAHLDASQPGHLFGQAVPGKNYLVLIGPEGDFSEPELAQALSAGFVKVSLGTQRLRTETAALAACHSLLLRNLTR
jgi:16S rRNA (uracil1498-N3)-methyltransferase